MVIKIVSDTTADIPTAIQKELDIKVASMFVRFGEKVYRDRVDINEDGFYKELLTNPIHPTTSQPSPQDFVDLYRKVSQGADGIISIHISSKLSGTCESARLATKDTKYDCPIEIIDSMNVSMGLGLIAIAAARMAKAERSFKEITEAARKSMDRVCLLATFDTLKFLAAGGRIGKAKALMGSMLNVKPLLTIKEGELVPAGQVRSRSKAIERLQDFACKLTGVQDISVVHSTTPQEAAELAAQIKSCAQGKEVIMSRLGTALGVHAGPGTLLVAALTQ